MYFDALTLAAVADELRATILGGRIQRVLLPGPLSIGLELYAQRQRYYLLASAHPQFARIHLVDAKLSRGVEQHTPLLLLLRKYVLAGRLVAINQLPLERILILSIAKEIKSRNPLEQVDADDEIETAPAEELSDEALMQMSEEPAPDQDGQDRGSERELLCSELIIEPMERRSNIILVDDNNIIMESVKRVTPRMSHRVILPRHVYELPPSQSKQDPRTATANDIASLLSETGETKLTRAIVARYRGVSPQVAREVTYRTLGVREADLRTATDLPWYALAAHLRDIFLAPAAPTLVPDVDVPQAYAPYTLTHLEEAQSQPTMSAALEAFYAAREAVTSHRRYRDATQQQLEAARERLTHQYNQLVGELERAKQLEDLRWEGEMIFAFLHTLGPGQSVLEVDGRTIALDPPRNPVECAQERFRIYDKAKHALEGIPERLKQTEHRLAGLEQLITLLSLTDEHAQIEQIALEAEEQGYIRSGGTNAQKQARAKRQNRVKPLHLISEDGFDIYVGRSSSQNADVTFRIGRPEDIWMHVRAIPGSHVIIRTGGREVPERTLHAAAGLAAYFSRVRDEREADVDLSRRSLVRKVVGGPPGLVTYRAERTLRVAPLPPW